MKKRYLSVAILASLFSASFAFAETPNSGYSSYTLQQPQMGLAAARSTGIEATNIIFVNESNYDIHAKIPEAGVDQLIKSGGTGLITHPSYTGNTHILIQGGNSSAILNADLCRGAIVTVYDGPDAFHKDISEQFCKLR